MKILLKKIKVDKGRLKSFLVKVIAKSISDLTEPCYCPNFKKHYYDILKLTHLNVKDIREFNKRRWKGRKEEKFDLFQDSIADFYIFLMYYFLNKNEQIIFRYLMIFYMIRRYISLFRKKFKYCNKEVFKYALENLNKTHLFSREKTISNALIHLSNEMIKKYSNEIKEDNIDKISKFIQESKGRISQSMKSFASVYYKASEEGLGLKTIEEPEDEETPYYIPTEKSTKAIDIVVKKITIYKFVDIKAQENARKLTKINSSLATLITNNINNVKNIDKIRTIISLFVRDIQNIDSLCGKDFYKYVRKLMSIKRTRAQIYFKQQINLLIIKTVEEIGYTERYNKLTSQTKFLVNLFLAYYLTLIFRNTICFK